MGREKSFFLPDIKRWNRLERPRNKYIYMKTSCENTYTIRKR